MNYDDIFAIDYALEELLNKDMPVDLALDIVNLYDEVHNLKLKGIKVLGPNPTEERINALAETKAEIKSKGIDKSKLICSLSEIKPILLYNLSKVLIDGEANENRS